MTDKELLSLITSYGEACDDLGTDLFNQTAAQTEQKRAKAESLWQQIGAEITRLHAEAAKSERRAITFGDIMNRHILAMRAAVVAHHREGANVGMTWIANTLEGPGHLPSDADIALGAQALFDKEVAEAEAFREAHPAP